MGQWNVWHANYPTNKYWRGGCHDLLPKAQEVYSKFTRMLTQYGKCHRVFNGGVVDDTTIDQLGK